MTRKGIRSVQKGILYITLFCWIVSCTKSSGSSFLRPIASPITDAALATDFVHLPQTGQLVYDTPNGKLWSTPLTPQAESTPLFPVPAGTFAFQPVWSTAAQQIAYGYIRPDPTTGEISSARLWIADLDGANAEEITLADSAFEGTYRDPAWSPDGRSLWATVQFPEQDERGVVRFRSEIRRINLTASSEISKSETASSETVIVSNGRGPAPAVDSQHLAYLAPELPPDQARFNESQRNAIWLATVDGENARVLVPSEQFEEIYVPMRFSPDGKFLAFAAADAANQLQRTPSAASGFWMINRLQMLGELFGPTAIYAHGLYPADVWLVAVETGKLERLTRLSEDHPTPVWSPDGAYLAFAGVQGMYVIDLDERSAVRIYDQGIDGQIEWVGD